MIPFLLSCGFFAQAGPDRFEWEATPASVAIYESFDGQRGHTLGEWVILGTELREGLYGGAVRDALLKMLFTPLKAAHWEQKEWKQSESFFAESPGLIDPLRADASFKVGSARKVGLKEVLKVSAGRKGEPAAPSVPPEIARGCIVEGEVQFRRGNWGQPKVVWDERRAVITMKTWRLVDLSTGWVVAARYQSAGKALDFLKLGSGGLPWSADATVEFQLKAFQAEYLEDYWKPRINEAIDRGTKWLMGQQAGDGSICDRKGYPIGTNGSTGATGLALEALLHSGVDPASPVIQRGFAFLRSKKSPQSYDMALTLCALEAKYLAELEKRGTGKGSEAELRKDLKALVTLQDRDWLSQLVSGLLECQSKTGSWGYTKGIDEPNFSTVQYCLLGLRAAARLGAKVPQQVWRLTFKQIEDCAIPGTREVDVVIVSERGEEFRSREIPQYWPYYSEGLGEGGIGLSVGTITMSTAAISSLSVLRSELMLVGGFDSEFEKRWVRHWRSACAGVVSRYSIRGSGPQGAWWGPAMLYYHLVSLERAVMLSGIKILGGHSWYPEGAAFVVSAQSRDGRWASLQDNPVIDTAFALLFLRRAIVVRDVATPRLKPAD
jgi:hypothetical protein